MGTVISQSPTYQKATLPEDGSSMVESYKAIQISNNAKEKNLKGQSIISSLPWKKNTVTSTKKFSKEIQPNRNYQNNTSHPNNQNLKTPESYTNLSTPIYPLTPQPQQQKYQISSPTNTATSINNSSNIVFTASPKRVVVHSSANELLRCLGEFLCRRCYRLKHLSPTDPVLWLRNVDRSLLLQGWQDQGFITPESMVFLYMLCRDVISAEVASEHELQAVLLTCLYLSYSYIGSEISYPLKPFLVENCKEAFWDRCLSIINLMSPKMLQLNSDAHYYTQVFSDLKNENTPEVGSQLPIGLDR